MSAALSQDLLSRLSGWATATFGLRFPPDRWTELGRGVASAALELGIPDLAGWAESLLSGTPPAEHLASVANHLTISETYFFRHPDTFRTLEHHILPACLGRRRASMPLRLWSAGCASGEEPYSVAILLERSFPAEASAAHIVGTDINSHVLARAHRAIYSEWSFRDTPAWVKSSHFTRLPNGRYHLHAGIRDRVQFRMLNLAAAELPAAFGPTAQFDVILCRNVLMYFSAEWQQRIVTRLVRALAPEGWLITGPCDLGNTDAEGIGLRCLSPGVFHKSPTWRGDADLPAFVLQPGLTSVGDAVLPAVADTVAPVPIPAVVTPPDPLTTELFPADALAARAQACADRGELTEALTACEDAIRGDKTHPGYYYLQGCILEELGRNREAEAAFRRVLFLEPDSVMAMFALACLADRAGRRDEARHHFTHVLQALQGRGRGESLGGPAGLTVGRLQAVVANNLSADNR